MCHRSPIPQRLRMLCGVPVSTVNHSARLPCTQDVRRTPCCGKYMHYFIVLFVISVRTVTPCALPTNVTPGCVRAVGLCCEWNTYIPGAGVLVAFGTTVAKSHGPGRMSAGGRLRYRRTRSEGLSLVLILGLLGQPGISIDHQDPSCRSKYEYIEERQLRVCPDSGKGGP